MATPPLPLSLVAPLDHTLYLMAPVSLAPAITVLDSFATKVLRTPLHMAATRTAKTSSAALLDEGAEPQSPVSCADALARTAHETCRQHERLSRLNGLGVLHAELEAAHALVDTCDLALAECVSTYQERCGKTAVSDNAEVHSKANSLWLAARDYLRRHSIAEKASQQLKQHDAEKLSDLQMEYELLASALLALKQNTASYLALRPEIK